ncbi:hypothetical protein CRG98_041591 [Punica granatum]|uniref:Uncharacterized protein n=1 Tax=Punica granatum TaxID=22663 RepID=A0A2I0I1Z8_PUNGR|nr:hypothetical protein CRG98_041591 [Punica granatum]
MTKRGSISRHQTGTRTAGPRRHVVWHFILYGETEWRSTEGTATPIKGEDADDPNQGVVGRIERTLKLKILSISVGEATIPSITPRLGLSAPSPD